MTSERELHTVSCFKSFVAGGVGGILCVITGYPLDTIKVRLQTTPRIRPGATVFYKGPFDCARKVIKTDGIFGLYRGVCVPVVGAAPVSALCFLGYNYGTKLFATDPTNPSNHEIAIAGMFSGVVTTSIVAPGERIKCLLQVQSVSLTERRYKGPIDVIQRLYQEGGLRSIFRGTAATLLRDVPSSGAYFLSYEWFKNALRKSDDTSEGLSVGSTVFAGGIAGIFDWLLASPFDALKSRYQTAPEGKYAKGIRSVFSEIITKENVFALYRGMTPVLLRAFPSNAACFLGYEMTIKFLNYLIPHW